jgi:monoamine oxidase
MATTRKVDVVVVGAGLAGLTAANQLVDGGVSVAVLEARDRVGGRTLNHQFTQGVAAGTTVELGGQWVGPTQDRVIALAEELGIGLFPQYNSGESMTFIDGEAFPFPDDDASWGLTDEALAEAERSQQQLEGMATKVPLDAPWSAPQAGEWDGQTFETWLRANVKGDHTRRFWRAVIRGVFSCQSTELSLLHFLFYIHSGGLLDRMTSVVDGAEESRVVGGSQAIAIALAARLGDVVELNSPVHAIDHSGDVVLVTHERGTAEAERVVVSVPPPLASRIRYTPALPSQRDQVTQAVQMGSVIKFQIAYATPFWREEGKTGLIAWLDEDAPVVVAYDNCPQDLRCGVMLGFFEGAQAREYATATMERRREVVIEALEPALGEKARQPIDYIDQDWAAEEWTRGCYGGRLLPGAWTQFGPALREPVDRLHWAGTETAEIWNGYMDGAVRSGERAAAEVAEALRESAAPVAA